MTARGRRLSKLEHRQREIDLQCPKCGLNTIMVPLEDGSTELRKSPEGEEVDLAMIAARLAYVGAMRGQQITIGDDAILDPRPAAQGWEVPTGASWMPRTFLEWLAEQAEEEQAAERVQP